jgi:predicted permease
MFWLRLIYTRLNGLLRKNRIEQEMEEEMRFHLRMRTRENIERGMKPDDAEREARRRFGNVGRIKDLGRDIKGGGFMETLWQDLRYGARMLVRNPGFTLVVVLSLALGIGANTAVFTLVNAVMLQSLPVRAPEELVAVGDASRPTALRVGGPMANIFSYPLYQRLRDHNTVFSGLLATGRTGRVDIIINNGNAEELQGRLVSGNYFNVLGISPVLGRTFSAEEDKAPGDSPVVVISYKYWEDRFGKDPSVLGSTVRINGSPFTVIGVGPRKFLGEVVGSPTDVWIPLSMQGQVNPGGSRLDNHDANWLLCIGRLKPGVSIEAARTEMTRLVHQALIDFENAMRSPDKLREIRSQAVPVQPGGKGFSWIRKHNAFLLYTLMAMVSLVLLIACANVANLLLARATAREKEISIRIALGANHRRLIRQLLTESLVLSCIAGAIGLMFAGWGSRVIARLASSASGPNPIPFEVDVRPDFAVLAFTTGVSILTAIIFGLIPSVRSTTINPALALRESGHGIGQSRWRVGRLLVVGQLALSVVLLIGAGLFLRTIMHLSTLDVGYSQHNLVLLSADLAGSGYAPEQRMPVVRRLLQGLRDTPGIGGVTVSENGLFSGTDSSTQSLRVEGFIPSRKDDSSCSFDQVGPNYFSAIGAQILGGRDFDERDTAGSQPVAIINQTMARYYFGTADPLGRYISNGGGRYVIVGIAKDTKIRDLKGKLERRYYTPLYQTTDAIGTFHFEVKTVDSAASLVTAVRQRVLALEPNLRVGNVSPVSLLINQSISSDRMIATLSGFFGILVLVLAANGLYGVISYTISRRTGEIGLRMAVGASRGDVIWMVLRETLMLMGAGILIGVPAGIAAGRAVAPSLSGVSATDPMTLIVVTLGMLLVGLLAGLIPAQRAATIDPLQALRHD